ncbi:MAG: hypothetical protein CM15mV116_220 [uncultured marine virus]|nr:MAG: hypothetical protein CM15mV116_220 [uncultured marine virus]
MQPLLKTLCSKYDSVLYGFSRCSNSEMKLFLGNDNTQDILNTQLALATKSNTAIKKR